MRLAAVLMLLALAACASEPETPEIGRQAAAGPPLAPAPPPRPRRAAPPAATAPQAQPATWRVARDGTTGCADSAVLRLLRDEPNPDAAALRRLAAARATGGCVTVFRALPWRLVERGEELLRLAPAGEGPGPLYFWRDQVTEER